MRSMAEQPQVAVRWEGMISLTGYANEWTVKVIGWGTLIRVARRMGLSHHDMVED